ncbi:MAG: NADH-quinone oxidoreductase subunit C [Planctomycetaceae bacterium]|nr:NADH-quinone oxidoreductase subunit C [Planctomycetaceae bacterium]
MNAEQIYARLEHPFRPWLVGCDLEAIDPWIEVKPDGLADVARFLREQPDLWFDMLHCITAVDYFEPDEKKRAQVEWQPHLELFYHLSSLRHRHRLVLKASLPRWLDDQPGRLPEAPSVSRIWSTAEWHEREVFDLSGVKFLDHPDLRRILCPEDWPGHPLRKDFVTPPDYHGVPTR